MTDAPFTETVAATSTDLPQESFREFLLRQINVCRRRAVVDDRKKSRIYHADMALVLTGILAEFDRRTR